MTEQITVFTQNSIRIRDQIGTIYIDPFQMQETPHDADYILITHDHSDHFSPEDIQKVTNRNTILICPENMETKARPIAALRQLVTVSPNEDYEIEGLSFHTVPAYNSLKPFHPKSAGWVGYLLVLNGQKIYVAGDTDATKEAMEVVCDIALVPIGGTFTMDVRKAAELINTIRPAVAIPTHYGSIVGSPEDGERFASLVKAPTKVEIKIGNR